MSRNIHQIHVMENHGLAHKEIKTNTAEPRDQPSGNFNSGSSGSSSWIRGGGGKKHEISMAVVGGHLFMTCGGGGKVNGLLRPLNLLLKCSHV